MVAAYSDEAQSSPHIFDCEHEAFEAHANIFTHLLELVATGQVSAQAIPSPDSFRFTPIDVIPASLDADIVSVSEAHEALSKFMLA